MPRENKKKPLEWSARAHADLDRIFVYYLEAAPFEVALQAVTEILSQARRIAAQGLVFRPGRKGTREYVMRRFPYTIVYRIDPGAVRVVRVLHQSRRYFNR